MKIIKLELTEEEASLMRGAIDAVIKGGGIPIARKMLPIDDKIVEADKRAGNGIDLNLPAKEAELEKH